MTGLLWSAADREGDTAWLTEMGPRMRQPDGLCTIGVDAHTDGRVVGAYLTRTQAQGLRDALDRLLTVGEQAQPTILMMAAAIADRAEIVAETVTAHPGSADHVAGSVETLANDVANLARLVGRMGGVE